MSDNVRYCRQYLLGSDIISTLPHSSPSSLSPYDLLCLKKGREEGKARMETFSFSDNFTETVAGAKARSIKEMVSLLVTDTSWFYSLLKFFNKNSRGRTSPITAFYYSPVL